MCTVCVPKKNDRAPRTIHLSAQIGDDGTGCIHWIGPDWIKIVDQTVTYGNWTVGKFTYHMAAAAVLTRYFLSPRTTTGEVPCQSH